MKKNIHWENMIYLLVNTVNGNIFYLTERKEYIIGRKSDECDILLENDNSISRKHAVIRVTDKEVTLKDSKARYHTLHKGKELPPEVETPLSHMDEIQFGIFNSKYRFEAYKFMVAASGLSVKQKASLQQNLSKCGGKLVDKWSEHCTHLTIDKLTLTVKVLQALIDEKPISSSQYWEDYARSIENNTSPPDITKYNKPPVAEQLLRSDFEFKIDRRRRTLFENKMFVFSKTSTKQQMEDVIKKCGGKCISWEEEPKTWSDIKKSPVEHLIVKHDSDKPDVSFDEVVKEMAKEQKRVIPINEIALAVVNCCCDVNCNPNFNKVNKVFATSTQKSQQRDVLVAETQSQNFLLTATVKTEKIIPPTIEDDWMATADAKENMHEVSSGSGGTKRLSEQNAEENFTKKPKLVNKKDDKKKQPKMDKFLGKPNHNVTGIMENETTKTKTQPSQKRKAVDDPEPDANPKINPFNLIKPTTNKKSKNDDESNPFELVRSSKAMSRTLSTRSDENPFASILNVSTRTKSTVKVEKIDNIKQEGPPREIKLIPMDSYNSGISSTTKRSFLNATWMSKGSGRVKLENKIKEEDSDMVEFSNAFKDCVKVDSMPVYNRPSTSKANNTPANDTVDGMKNFKKFKKVRPLRPQITIISRHQFKRVAPGDVSAIDVSDENKDSDDENERSNAKTRQPPKSRGKRFVL